MLFLQRLLLWQRFAILGIIGVLLVGPPLYLFLDGCNTNIEFSYVEQQGLKPGDAVLGALQQVQLHRGLSAAFLRGGQLAQRRSDTQHAVDAALTQMDQALRGDDHAINTVLDQVRSGWSALVAGVGAGTVTP